MRKKATSISINNFSGEYHTGISIDRSFIDGAHLFDVEGRSERHDRHTFHLLEKGEMTIEIDFRKYKLQPLSLIYMHPNQVHRILTMDDVCVVTLAINNENLYPEYLELFEELSPAEPLLVSQDTCSIISEAVSLFIKFSRLESIKLHHPLLRDSGNALVALFASPYLEQAKSANKLSRFEMVTRRFKNLLDKNFTVMKSPAAYAEKLSISNLYLNECVKKATGFAVSHHIQQRVVLEAQRLLHHSNKSIKEISAELGYDDAAYFSRIFSKVAGMSASAFRSKNHK